MTFDQILFLVYAVLLISGAFIGFKAGSKASLIAGSISAVLCFLGVYLLGTQPRTGYIFLLVLNAALVIVFSKRFLKTKKFMPSGMLLSASGLLSILCLVRILQG